MIPKGILFTVIHFSCLFMCKIFILFLHPSLLLSIPSVNTIHWIVMKVIHSFFSFYSEVKQKIYWTKWKTFYIYSSHPQKEKKVKHTFQPYCCFLDFFSFPSFVSVLKDQTKSSTKQFKRIKKRFENIQLKWKGERKKMKWEGEKENLSSQIDDVDH